MARADAVDADAAAAILTDRAPLHGEVARELDDGRLGRVVHGREQALVGDQAAHARDQADAAVALVLEHLARRRRRRHHHPRVVHRQHLGHVFLCVLHRRRQLLNPRCGDHAVQPLVLAGYLADRVVESSHVNNVLLPVLQRPAPMVGSPQRLVVILMGVLVLVKTVDYVSLISMPII